MEKLKDVKITNNETGEVKEFAQCVYLIKDGFVMEKAFWKNGGTFITYKKGNIRKTVQVFMSDGVLPEETTDVVRETLRKLTIRERKRLQQEWGQLVMDSDDDLVKDDGEEDEDVINRMADAELDYLSERIQSKLQQEEILLTRTQRDKLVKQREAEKAKANPSKTIQPDPSKEVKAGQNTKKED